MVPIMKQAYFLKLSTSVDVTTRMGDTLEFSILIMKGEDIP